MNTILANDNDERGLVEVGSTGEETTQLFCYPSPKSVKGRVLGALLRGERLSTQCLQLMV